MGLIENIFKVFFHYKSMRAIDHKGLPKVLIGRIYVGEH